LLTRRVDEHATVLLAVQHDICRAAGHGRQNLVHREDQSVFELDAVTTLRRRQAVLVPAELGELVQRAGGPDEAAAIIAGHLGLVRL
jgi:hypothetical protein